MTGTDEWTVTEPAVIDGMPDHVYHADPVVGGSLSASGAKTLLKAPALFAWERQHGRPDRRQYDDGHAAHRLVLGVGPELVRIDAEEWRSKAVKEEVAAVREAGGVPLRPSQWDTAHAMAAALRAHPIASALLDPTRGGKPEQSLFWRGTDVWLRARLDWMPDPAAPGRPTIADYKTCDKASPVAIRRAVADYGYHLQDAWYRAAVDNVLGIDAAFCFIFQEKHPPHLVTVAQLEDDAIAAGHRAMRCAIETYRECTESGTWPGYIGDQEIADIDLPPWASRYEEYA